MRLQQLDLIRYGKFTEQRLAFPRSACDFHLIVGANEAGKSTLRRAVAELLYGMPLRSDMDFLHPLPELRLGAVVESAAGTLAFQRRRGRKPLCTPQDETLAENVLTEHLGGASEGLFNRMFCLDLKGLVAGGQSILDASDDMGQLLFQSAAGIAHLGPLRDALEAEAVKLYAPRKAGDRAFYQGLERYEAARQALKTATVNTRQWAALKEQVDATAAALASADAEFQRLQGERLRLERIRRIGPSLAKWQEAQAETQALAGVTPLPPEAARQLSEAELNLATHSAQLTLHQTQHAELHRQRDALHPDERLLALAPQVDALATTAHTLANHRRDIERRQEEVRALLREAADLAAQLGWPVEEAPLRAHLPTTLALRTVQTLLRERGAHVQAEQAAQEAQQRAAAALERLQQRQAQQPAPPPSAQLLAALQEAQLCRQGLPAQHSMRQGLQETERQLAQALAALAPWQHDPATLARLRLPTEERLTSIKQARATLEARMEEARKQHAQAGDQQRRSELALAQFAAGRHLVTQDEVLHARQQRDTLWQRIKTHALALDAGAAPLDDALRHADRLVDAQRDSATDSATLLRLRQECERDTASAQARSQERQAAEQALAEFESRWAQLCTQAGVPGMALADASAWLTQRRHALELAQQQQSQALALQTQHAQAQAALHRLQQALHEMGAPLPAEAGLADACLAAEQLIGQAQAARTAAELLAQQLQEAQAELAHHTAQHTRQTEALRQWQARWQAALATAQLPQLAQQAESAAAALELAERIAHRLAEVEDKRVSRIQAMQIDLDALARQTADLLHALGEAPPPAAQPQATLAATPTPPQPLPDPFPLIQQLAGRLQQARELRKEWERLTDALARSSADEREAEAALAATRATLSSLHTAAGTQDSTELRRLIEASNRRRHCEAELRQLQQTLLSAGDGLGLDALRAECASLAPEQVVPQLEAAIRQQNEAVERKTQLTAELTQARAALATIHGSAEAAVAEAQRHEALAQMGEAAQRYMKVSSAARLLRWAIERYRERQQGPLLQRAGQLFAQFTLGGFERLVPDLDTTPPRLIALRNTGERVPIEGLSEGTRDQLFLALRLAALELHIGSARPLPFIADDLFVNFHDARSRAGLAALGELAQRTQVIFLTHHEHLAEVARQAIGADINVVRLA